MEKETLTRVTKSEIITPKINNKKKKSVVNKSAQAKHMNEVKKQRRIEIVKKLQSLDEFPYSWDFYTIAIVLVIIIIIAGLIYYYFNKRKQTLTHDTPVDKKTTPVDKPQTTACNTPSERHPVQKTILYRKSRIHF